MRFGQKKPGLQPLPPQLSDAWQARTVTFADWMFLRLRNASLARFSTRLGRANRDRADCLHTSHNVLQCFLTGFVDPGMFPVRASAQGSRCVLRTFGPYHQQNFVWGQRISGTTNTEVSETQISASNFALYFRRFTPCFISACVFKSSYDSLQISMVVICEFAKFEYQTGPYAKINCDFQTLSRNRKICRQNEGKF